MTHRSREDRVYDLLFEEEVSDTHLKRTAERFVDIVEETVRDNLLTPAELGDYLSMLTELTTERSVKEAITRAVGGLTDHNADATRAAIHDALKQLADSEYSALESLLSRAEGILDGLIEESRDTNDLRDSYQDQIAEVWCTFMEEDFAALRRIDDGTQDMECLPGPVDDYQELCQSLDELPEPYFTSWDTIEEAPQVHPIFPRFFLHPSPSRQAGRIMIRGVMW